MLRKVEGGSTNWRRGGKGGQRRNKGLLGDGAATFLTLTRCDFRADSGAALNRGDVDTLLLFILWDAFLVYYI